MPTLNAPSAIAAAILAGGKSSRMGKPKALLDLDGKPLVEHLADRLRNECDEIFIAGCPEPERYRGLSLALVEDDLPDVGPLGGMAAALEYLMRKNAGKTADFRYLLVVPCDGVVLPPGFVARLFERMVAGNHELVFSRDAEREQPLYALLRTDVLPELQQYLHRGGRKVIDWYRTRDYAVVDFSTDGFRFSNLNTPHDWQTFLSVPVRNTAVVRPSGGNGSANAD